MTFVPLESESVEGYYKPIGIGKMKIDGTEDQQLVSGIGAFRFFLADGGIYFLMQENETESSSLFRMNFDGTERTKIQDHVAVAVYIDGWIYYIPTDQRQLNKMNADGTIIIPLYTSAHWITALNYHQGWIYMVNGTFGIHGSAFIDKLKIDGTGHAGLVEARPTSLYIADTTLYFRQAWEVGVSSLEHIEAD